MTSFETLTLEIDDGLAVVTLDRPDAGNSMIAAFFDDFGALADDLTARGREIRAVLVRSTGRFFSVGGDVGMFAERIDELPAAVFAGTRAMHPALARLARLDAPIVAAVQGTAMGGAVAMLSTFDLVVSARSARFGAAYSQLGLSLDLGASFGLASRMGIARARRFLLLGEVLDAEAAERVGLVDEVVDDVALDDTTLALARRLAAGPTRAYGEVRRLLAQSLRTPFETQLEEEAHGLARTGATRDGREGITAFMEKRAPVFRGE
ncbi:MAG: hypothetical protein JWN36_2981 [Microbacteriaceae bacterium]|nr:hypothetical protein [Microbacteriaceae bacterium]